MKSLALVALVCSLAACSQASPGVKFAIAETSAARWIGPTTLSLVDRNVNMMEPLSIENDAGGGAVVLSYARRGREGVRVTIDAASLTARSAEPFVFAEHARRSVAPPCEKAGGVTVTTKSGAVRLWTDDATGRILAGPPATAAPVAVLPADVQAFGQPVAVVVDDRRVVFAFFRDEGERFELLVGAFEHGAPR